MSNSITKIACRLLFLIALCPWLSTAHAADSAFHPGLRIDFPNDPELPCDKFGVFIGIGRYSGLPASVQLDGPAHDVTALKDIFSTTFGVKRIAMLTDEQATRQNIGEVLEALVEQVRLARQKSTGPISVVIVYAGHGSRVQRTAEGLRQNPNSPDESTWVCADSSGTGAESGDKDFRASELFKIHTALAGLGAQVVMISDACHSGTGFRGNGKIRALSREVTPAGPKDDLFPHLPNPAAAGTAEQLAAATSNFAWYAACGNGQFAFEGPDSHGNPSGYFTAVLCDLLPHISPETTYGELAAQLSARFAIEHPMQSPEFHAPTGKVNERFLRGGFAPVHAEVILPGYQTGNITDHVKLNMGTVHGVAVGAKFTFYANSTDFESRKNPIAVVAVTADADVQPLDCTLPLDAGSKIPPTAWAELDAQRMNDVRVGLDGSIPDSLKAKLQELDLKKRFTLVDGLSKADLAIHFDDKEKVIGIYDAGAQLPTAGVSLSDPSQPRALRGVLPFEKPEDADEICTNLLYVIRVRRLVSLTHVGSGGNLLKCEIRLQTAGGGAATQPADDAGIPQLLKGQLFTVHFTNTRRRSVEDAGLYLTIFSLDANGGISLLYPRPNDSPVALKAGQDFDFPSVDSPLRATIDDPSHIAARGELTQLFIIAADREVDFSALVAPPDNGAGNARGINAGAAFNPLANLMGNAAAGARGVGTTDITSWASNRLTFYVDQPDLHKKP